MPAGASYLQNLFVTGPQFGWVRFSVASGAAGRGPGAGGPRAGAPPEERLGGQRAPVRDRALSSNEGGRGPGGGRPARGKVGSQRAPVPEPGSVSGGRFLPPPRCSS